MPGILSVVPQRIISRYKAKATSSFTFKGFVFMLLLTLGRALPTRDLQRPRAARCQRPVVTRADVARKRQAAPLQHLGPWMHIFTRLTIGTARVLY